MIKISTDRNKLNIQMIHQFLTHSYWAKGRTLDEVKSSIEHSLNFGIYLDKKQIGYARICTDYTVFAYLMDVFIVSEFRGQGFSNQLMKFILEDSRLANCKVWMLKTADAHDLYQQFGYSELKNPERVMERILN